MQLKIKFNSRIISIFLFSVVIVSCNLNIKKGQTLQNTSRLDSLFNAAVINEEIPGAVIYLTKNKSEIYHKAYGFSDLENKAPLKEEAIFRMASMTKGLTALAVLQLIEKGLLDLDDKVSKFIPEFRDP